MSTTRTRRGFGQLRQLPSGRWQAAYTGPDTRRHKAPHTFAAKPLAEGWLATEYRKIELGTWGRVERSDAVTVADYAEQWMAQRDHRPRTRALYRSMLDRLVLPALGSTVLATLTPARVRQWHADLGTVHKTRNAHAYGLLHAICATAVADEILDANPCRIWSAMQTSRRREIEVLTPAQLSALASHMPDDLAMSVLLAGWCSLRWGETSELRRGDVTPDGSTLKIRRAVTYRGGAFTVGSPKTAAGVRDVAVPPHIRPMLVEHLRDHVGSGHDSLLFPGADGGHLREDIYRTPWRAARAAIGKAHFRVHDLRHAGAVLASHSGATTKDLMHRLGHTTPAMALRYQHISEGRDSMLAERMSELATT